MKVACRHVCSIWVLTIRLAEFCARFERPCTRSCKHLSKYKHIFHLLNLTDSVNCHAVRFIERLVEVHMHTSIRQWEQNRAKPLQITVKRTDSTGALFSYKYTQRRPTAESGQPAGALEETDKRGTKKKITKNKFKQWCSCPMASPDHPLMGEDVVYCSMTNRKQNAYSDKCKNKV